MVESVTEIARESVQHVLLAVVNYLPLVSFIHRLCKTQVFELEF